MHMLLCLQSSEHCCEQQQAERNVLMQLYFGCVFGVLAVISTKYTPAHRPSVESYYALLVELQILWHQPHVLSSVMDIYD